jgi:hypothetical protein
VPWAVLNAEDITNYIAGLVFGYATEVFEEISSNMWM